MGKFKVYELAKELGITNSELIERLKKLGLEVKSHLSVIDDNVSNRLRANNSMSNSKDEKKASQDKGQMHIIRRNIKVINTDGNKSEVEQITTDISGSIRKSHHTVVSENNRNENKNFDKKDSGYTQQRQQNRNMKPRFGNRPTNIVITRNGKPIEKNVSKVESSNPINSNIKPANNDSNSKRINSDSYESTRNKDQNRRSDFDSNRNSRPNYSDRKPYNNQNRSNNNGYNSNGYNNQNRSNNNGYNNRADKPYNNRNSNNNTSFNNGGYSNNRPYNNNRNFQNNTTYQVNKFIKQAAATPVEQKETREYENTMIDKKKYNNDRSVNDNKKEKLDKNKLREQNTRISTSKLKGLEVDSRSLMDLYERDSDLSRKQGVKRKKQIKPVLNQTKIIPMTEVKLPEIMTVKEFAESIKKQASDIIKKLFNLGIMATVNQEIDFDTAYLIAGEFGITAQKDIKVTEEDILFDDSEDEEDDLEVRPPIVVVMGHVDHGKTSLLDKIRSENVVNKEAGGITQHIGAYKVKCKNREICFLDTPGHEAFTAMRARGAQVTDIAIIVVAADDGIKPQTIEAIDHAKAAGVSIIVAINKIDKPNANVDRVKQELLEVGLVPEEWGGETICVPISAMTGEGIDTLLEMILLVADVKELKSNPDKQSKGTVLEARLDKNSGTIVSMLVQRGTLNVGDTIVVGDVVGRIRAMKDDKGRKVKAAGPSTPVEVLGLSHVPQTGDVFYEVENEKVAKQLISRKIAERRTNLIKQGQKVTLGDLFNQIKEGKIKELNVIIKADVEGSVEALKESLEKLSNEEVRVRVLHASTGGIKESDVTLASVSNAIIIGFNVRPESRVEQQAKKENVDLRLYRVIYDAIDDVETAMKGMLAPKYREEVLGKCEIRRVFKLTNVGVVAGCYVKEGKVVRGTMVRLVRDSIVLHEAKIDSLKREKDDAKEVAAGYECGIKLENFTDIKEGDILECFQLIEEKRG